MRIKFLASFFLFFLLLVSTVSAVTFESGVNFSYDNITATFSENTSMDNFSTYSTGFLFGDHNISLYTNESSNLTINSWSESSNSFTLQSNSLIYFDISVPSKTVYTVYDGSYVTSPFLASGSKSFLYQFSPVVKTLEEEQPSLNSDILAVKEIFLIASGLLSLIILGFMIPDIIRLISFKGSSQILNKRILIMFLMLLVIGAVNGVAFLILNMLAAA